MLWCFGLVDCYCLWCFRHFRVVLCLVCVVLELLCVWFDVYDARDFGEAVGVLFAVMRLLFCV